MTIRCIHCGTVIADRPVDDLNEVIHRHLEQCPDKPETT